MIRETLRKWKRYPLYFERLVECEAAARTMHARRAILADPCYAERLVQYGHKVYSQNDEDGIIAEIFERIGTTSKRFLEIGVGNGSENNTLTLLLQGWSGGWIDASHRDAKEISEHFTGILGERLKFVEDFVTVESIATLASQAGGLDDLDLFSIDIDGNEYHILNVLDLQARVVVVEYNAKLRPPIDWVMPYKADYAPDGIYESGASLAALERLMTARGYALIGCNITGVNAFFVRREFATAFPGPHTAQHHYEPARYWMTPGFVSGYTATPRL
ncbi:MAG TPA: FkbM family methyltransferase [Acidobacteriaceae bacterium]